MATAKAWRMNSTTGEAAVPSQAPPPSLSYPNIVRRVCTLHAVLSSVMARRGLTKRAVHSSHVQRLTADISGWTGLAKVFEIVSSSVSRCSFGFQNRCEPISGFMDAMSSLWLMFGTEDETFAVRHGHLIQYFLRTQQNRQNLSCLLFISGFRHFLS